MLHNRPRALGAVFFHRPVQCFFNKVLEVLINCQDDIGTFLWLNIHTAADINFAALTVDFRHT